MKIGNLVNENRHRTNFSIPGLSGRNPNGWQSQSHSSIEQEKLRFYN